MKNKWISLAALLVSAHLALGKTAAPPNILWLYVEDISSNLGCYGDRTVATPRIDQLAQEGTRFTQAFTTAPVCSPSRSALISGMYQATLGAHNHRSQTLKGKAGGNEQFYPSYPLPAAIQLLPALFQQAGYYTALGGKREGAISQQIGKTDYNFVWNDSIYDGDDWSERAEGQPFFAQIQLNGGKAREAPVEHPIDPATVVLPPYYPDRPVVRQAWAEYLNAIQVLDAEIGQILDRLESEGLADNTVVFFFSDHGVSHLRGKQFVYDEGMRIPLIVRYPNGRGRGKVRNDLISHLDIAATSLDLAGIPVPSYGQGQSWVSEDYQPRSFVYSGRDRCDETVDVIRAIRTPRFKYIRNYYASRPHAQYNRYRDGYPEVQLMREMFAQGELDSLPASMFQPYRPVEELYDLSTDPYETHSLTGVAAYQDTLRYLRQLHHQSMRDTRDLGLIPEPELEALGLQYSNKYFILQQPENQGLTDTIRAVIEAGEQEQLSVLAAALHHPSPSVRYWAATGLGYLLSDETGEKQRLLKTATQDPSATVRVAAARSLGRLGHAEQALPVLTEALSDANALVRLYAILGLESLGPVVESALATVQAHTTDDYEYVRRVANRLVRTYDTARRE